MCYLPAIVPVEEVDSYNNYMETCNMGVHILVVVFKLLPFKMLLNELGFA